MGAGSRGGSRLDLVQYDVDQINDGRKVSATHKYRFESPTQDIRVEIIGYGGDREAANHSFLQALVKVCEKLQQIPLVPLIMLLVMGCTTTPTIQERIHCRELCHYSVKDVCHSRLGGWTICDCKDGTRYRVSEWGE